ncbi:hypothetical protein [Streptomyces albireticuli]|uniref:Gram-positive cocci surface proteins LPxTG domain-containing protein n=1 Tax=Streptomyces albireticuli TaxID=1940 RepID=A0A2A2DAG0_9ACTN|nr:hypothetical protein [Streptomyces albireticuli]MCD9144822.1 hypothetical protein [Streptomyces albireticuli]MCD9165691.1 hypothetical protein [Streptomyces albireticuli]MCD9193729.1 hypothetical protein [Streptomyces albireticuli]PAU48427.1 hypothetical protein CK936_13330 [Streptomyces albireticuli]
MNPTTRTALRTAVTTTVLAGVVAVPTAAFATDGSPAPAAAGGSAQPAGRTVDIGGGVEAEIKGGKAYLKEIGTGKVFAVLSKGQSYTDGIYVHFDGTNVTARTQGEDKKKDDKKKDGKKDQGENGEAARATTGPAKGGAKADAKTDAKTDGAKKLPKGGVAAGEAPASHPDTDPGVVGGALAAAGVLGGAGLLAARRRKGAES